VKTARRGERRNTRPRERQLRRRLKPLRRTC
jgi:hypothetical protein